MDRKAKALLQVDPNAYGIEIGPSHNPIAPKKDGYKVHIIDHMSCEQLITKYTNHNVNLNNIEEVDFVWNGESFSELTGKSKYYDWIIASHLIEHTPDLIAFINNCDTILKDNGVISLVIPDKRFCFDHFRPITGISRIIDSHFQKPIIHSPGTVAEYYLNVVAKSGGIAWDAYTAGTYRFVHTLEDALRGVESVINDKAYLDVHAWCFTPHSFRLIIHDLFNLGFIPFQELSFSPTVGCEFFVTLSRKGSGVDKSRLEMLELIESELKHEVSSLEESETMVAKCRGVIKRIISKLT